MILSGGFTGNTKTHTPTIGGTHIHTHKITHTLLCTHTHLLCIYTHIHAIHGNPGTVLRDPTKPQQNHIDQKPQNSTQGLAYIVTQ